MDTFSEWVRTQRTAQGLSRADLARKAGLSWSHVDWIESGKSVPTLSVAGAISEALGVPLWRALRVIAEQKDEQI